MKWSVALSILIIMVSAAFAIYGKYKKQRFIHYAFKPLTMLLIISLAWERTVSSPSLYGYFVLSGLCISLLGDIFLMLPSDKFKQGLLAFFVAHLLYIFAFSRNLGVLSFSALAPIAVFGAVIFFVLWAKIKGLRVFVLIYILAICAMAWLAVNRYLFFADQKSLMVMAGGLLFLVSDALNALNRFRKAFGLAQLIILATYFAAQLAFALSL